MLIVCDLRRILDTGPPSSPAASEPTCPQATAYVINFPHPLTRELAPVEERRTIGDGLLGPGRKETGSRRHSTVVKLVEHRVLADSTQEM